MLRLANKHIIPHKNVNSVDTILVKQPSKITLNSYRNIKISASSTPIRQVGLVTTKKQYFSTNLVRFKNKTEIFSSKILSSNNNSGSFWNPLLGLLVFGASTWFLRENTKAEEKKKDKDDLMITYELASTFPSYQTHEDVHYWLQYYYKHPEPKLVKLALEILNNEAEFINEDKTAYIQGVLAGIFMKNPDQTMQLATDLYTLFSEDQPRGMLGVALWMAGTPQAAQALQQLITISTSESTKEIYTTLQANPITNLYVHIARQMQFGNVQMKLGMLRGLFCATGDPSYLRILYELGSHWKKETLEEKTGLETFYSASVARTELLTLCINHPIVLENCATEERLSSNKDIKNFLNGVLKNVANVISNKA